MLEIRGLHKSFGGKPALHDVSFNVARGEIHGLLGHNGAGKSTTLGIILGMVMPDSGDVSIGGVSVLENRSQALRKVVLRTSRPRRAGANTSARPLRSPAG